MRIIIQRVTEADLAVDDQPHASIGPGLVSLVGFQSRDADLPALLDKAAEKLLNLRVFRDDADRMNRSLLDRAAASEPAGLLLVPNFTVAGSTAKGRRPSFDDAMPPDAARPAFTDLVARVAALAPDALAVRSGVFGASMKVRLTNDGPVTLLVEL